MILIVLFLVDTNYKCNCSGLAILKEYMTVKWDILLCSLWLKLKISVSVFLSISNLDRCYRKRFTVWRKTLNAVIFLVCCTIVQKINNSHDHTNEYSAWKWFGYRNTKYHPKAWVIPWCDSLCCTLCTYLGELWGWEKREQFIIAGVEHLNISSTTNLSISLKEGAGTGANWTTNLKECKVLPH